MMIFIKTQVVGYIFVFSALLIAPVSHAGSLLKLDLASHAILSDVLEAAKLAYEKEYGTNEKEIHFKRLNFSPAAQLLFLTSQDDDSDLTKVNVDSQLSAAELVKNAAQEVANKLSAIEVASKMEIITQNGVPGGVPSAEILPGTEYHVVIIQLPDATKALCPLMEKLKEEVTKVVTRDSSVKDYPPRIQLTVGYVVNTAKPKVVAFKGLDQKASFSVNNFTLDFPKMVGFKNLLISPDSTKK